MIRILIIFSFLIFGCSNPDNKYHIEKSSNQDTNNHQPDTTSIKEVNSTQIDTSILGDINGDNKGDTAFIVNPKFNNQKEPFDDGCVDNDCSVTIKFSCDLPSIHFENAIGGGVDNIGDINKDRVCEIMFIPAWFQGCWSQMYFYTFKNNDWVRFDQVKGYFCLEEDFKKRVKKINQTTIEVIQDTLIEGEQKQQPVRIKLNK